MKSSCKFIIVLLALTVVNGSELSLAESCDEEQCQLPSCRCSSVDVPGNVSIRDTPQFVLLTFDDAVNNINIETYREVIYGRVNKNQCPAGATFFVSHEYTDYTAVNELYNRGLEIALHSITHQTPQDYWREAEYETLIKEFADQRDQLSHFANVPASVLSGIRSPFLQSAGNSTFEMMASAGFSYDLSWPTISHTNPGLWPYTLDYASIQDCPILPCPTASIPGPWVLPMVVWFDLNNTPCSMVDSCFFIPDREDEEEWFKFIVTNFERHYLGNRSPFGFYVHEWFVRAYPAVKRALIRFLDLVNNLNDAFMVNAQDVVNWVQNPIPTNEYVKQPCKRTTPTTCVPRFCGPLQASHTELAYYMTVCSTTCPRVYPWINNPLGN